MKTYRTFWVLLGGFAVSFIAIFYFIANRFMASSESHQEEMAKKLFGNPFAFPKVWLTSSWFGGIFFVIVGMLFILLITNEVQYKTHRQNIIDGWSRFDFLKAKFTMLIFLTIVSTIVVLIAGLLVGAASTPANESYSFFGEFYYIGYFILMVVAYLMVAFVIAILIKRTGLSIIIYFGFVFIIDNLLWILLTYKHSQVGYFLPLESTDSLVHNPFNTIFQYRTVSDLSLIITALAYITLFGVFITNYFKRIDLKN